MKYPADHERIDRSNPTSSGVGQGKQDTNVVSDERIAPCQGKALQWVRVEGKIGTVGMTDYAQQELGEIVHIELPKIGSIVKEGEEVCVLESTKSATDIDSPVTGKIVAVNPALKASPGLINQSPEMDGWLYRIELTDY
jgi:glycine cleavage system H protein